MYILGVPKVWLYFFVDGPIKEANQPILFIFEFLGFPQLININHTILLQLNTQPMVHQIHHFSWFCLNLPWKAKPLQNEQLPIIPIIVGNYSVLWIGVCELSLSAWISHMNSLALKQRIGNNVTWVQYHWNAWVHAWVPGIDKNIQNTANVPSLVLCHT
jgi:hypothetical protein